MTDLSMTNILLGHVKYVGLWHWVGYAHVVRLLHSNGIFTAELVTVV